MKGTGSGRFLHPSSLILIEVPESILLHVRRAGGAARTPATTDRTRLRRTSCDNLTRQALHRAAKRRIGRARIESATLCPPDNQPTFHLSRRASQWAETRP